MGRITILDSLTANKIAAGEIVEGPAAVIKELMENSLDAQANFIEIEIKEGGLSLIRVTDNGIGMERDDALLSLERHATSKIKDTRDLFNISTFGFRGEALPSIASVSSLVLTTKDELSQLGTRIKVLGGRIEGNEEVAFTRGTTLEVRNLFYNTPARRKFLKGVGYEAGQITELLTKYSLGHPGVRFKLISNQRVVYDTAGLNTVAERINEIYGEALEDKFIHIPREKDRAFALEAWLAPPSFNRNTRSQQTFFINGRLVKSMELSKALDEGYHTLLPKGRFPVVVLHLTIDNQSLDVNIHPAKVQVKIFNVEMIQEKIIAKVKEYLWNSSLNGSLKKANDANYSTMDVKKEGLESRIENPVVQEKGPVYRHETLSLDSSGEDCTRYHKDQTGPRIELEGGVELELGQGSEPKSQLEPATQSEFKAKSEPKSEPKSQVEPVIQSEFKAKSEPGALASSPLLREEGFSNGTRANRQGEPDEKIQIKNISDLMVIGQLHNSFILAQNKEGLYIIDQHTCHERILYERFLGEEQNKAIVEEGLLIPITLTLSGEQEGILLKNILVLKDLGFLVESFGTRTYLLRAIPLGIAKANLEQFFIDLLEELNYSVSLSVAKIKEKILIMAACKGAVKANQKLTKEEIIALLKDLARVKNAQTCPHGRPIFHKLSMEELYKIFQRGEFRCD